MKFQIEDRALYFSVEMVPMDPEPWRQLANDNRQQLLSPVLPTAASRWLNEINTRPELLSPTLPPLKLDTDTPALVTPDPPPLDVSSTRSVHVFISKQVFDDFSIVPQSERFISMYSECPRRRRHVRKSYVRPAENSGEMTANELKSLYGMK